MRITDCGRRLRLAWRLAALLLLIPLGQLLAAPAYALNAGCRSDPTVLLSNGLVLDLSADIGAPLTDVQQVVYTLHVPAGVAMVARVSTPSWPTTSEQISIVADNPPNRYTSSTRVVTRQYGTHVRANLLAGLSLGWTDGFDQQDLIVTLIDP